VGTQTLSYDGRPSRSRETKPTTFETLTADTLHVPAGSTMVFDFGGEARLDSVMAGAAPLFYGELTGRGGKGLQATRRDGRIEIPADLRPGEYLVLVHVSGPEGEADYAFRVAVEPDTGSLPTPGDPGRQASGN
jgi:hypothetical protein